MESQYKVAVEFGYPPFQVKWALQQHQFPCAGDLVNFLYDLQIPTDEEDTMAVLHNLTLGKEEEEELQQPKEIAEIKAVLQEETLSPSALKTDTALLLHMTRCLCCHENDRNIVILPCSHLTHCLTCSPSVSSCPRHDCQMVIERKILVYRT